MNTNDLLTQTILPTDSEPINLIINKEIKNKSVPIDYDDVLEEITDINKFVDICDKHGYTDERIKMLAKKLPADYDISVFPDNLQKLIKHYQYSTSIIMGLDNGKIKILNLKTGKVIKILKGHNDRINDMVVTTDNKYIISLSRDYVIKIWEAETSKLLHTITDDTQTLYALAITPDNKYLVTISYNFTINVRELENIENIRTILNSIDSYPIGLDPNINPLDTVDMLVITTDNKYIIAGSTYGKILIWEFETGILVNTFYDRLIQSLAVTTDNKYIVSASANGTIKIWEVETGKITNTLTDHNDMVYCVKITSNNKYIVSGSCDCTIKIWDLMSGKNINTINAHKYHITSLVITQDNRFIISGSDDNTIKVWQLKTGKLIHLIKSNIKITSVAITYPIPYPE